MGVRLPSRAPLSMSIDTQIDQITKLPKPLIAALKKLGLLSVRDLLLYFPYRYLDFSRVKQIKNLKPGENVSVRSTIKSIISRFSFRGRISLAEGIVSDETGSIKVIWFNQPYLAKSLSPGEEIFLSGAPEIYNGILQFANPIYEKASDFPVHTSRLLPVYHLTAKLYPKTLRSLVAKALPLADNLTDNLPQMVLKSQNLPTLSQTVKLAHFPEKYDDIILSKKRLAFEEIFINHLSAQQYKMLLAQKQSFSIKFDQPLIKNFVDSLPFKLTGQQKKCAWEILQDLKKPMPMNRLLEGDVGAGKTLVALIAALQTIRDGFQVAFLAPTEILAQQHFQTALKFQVSPKISGRLKMGIWLLTNNYSKSAGGNTSKVQLRQLITDGAPGLYIGTHALLENKIKFKNLALVIIDEQHRFGVEQRASLMGSGKKTPHLLSLSATPIPRSLQLAFYGELDISQIKTKPLGRKPIITRIVDEQNRAEAYEFIKKQIDDGRQAFVITPLIEESDKLGVKSAKSEIEKLKKIFPELKTGLLHGKMRGQEKENVMKQFLENKIQILVSTSIVEVGVDVPNASVMIIEGAERFGLAQLHQFRGRVGRAEHQSYCFLFLSRLFVERAEKGGKRDDAAQRFSLFSQTQNGFELAELDLKLRGFGEIYGSAQSGINYKYFDPSYTSLIAPAREEARKLLLDDINLDKYPLLKAKIADKIIHFE